MDRAVQLLFSTIFLMTSIHSSCGLNGTVIRSPNFPNPYPSDSCESWTIATTSGKQILIVVKTLVLEELWDTLTINHTSPDLQAPFTSRIRRGVEGFAFAGVGVTNISFCSDTRREFTGFELEYIISEIKNDSLAQLRTLIGKPTYTCRSQMQLVAADAQCNGVFDCADYSDDVECYDEVFGGMCGPGYYQCEGLVEELCLSSDRVCDGWDDCPLGDDENNCETLMCPSNCSCGESAFYGRFGPDQPQCNNPNWLPFWVNCTSGWNNEYTINTAPKTIMLNLNGAPIKDLQPGTFHGLENVQTLDVSSAQLKRFPPGIFVGMHRLVKIIAENNSLTYLERNAFQGLYHLRLLYLDFNHIARLDEGCFLDLHSLFFIGLDNNALGNFRPGAFKDLGGSLERLVIPDNNITSVNSSMFDGIRENLLLLSLENNPVSTIAPGTFINLSSVTDLYLLLRPEIPLTLYPEFYDGLESLTTVFAYDPRICCIVPSNVKCNLREPSEPLFTCRMTFLHNSAIKIFTWFLAFASLFGNVYVFVSRITTKHTNSVAQIQSIFIANLAISDFLMGVYLLILAIADAHIGETYFWEGLAQDWRRSPMCRFAGFLSFLSSETSVFLIVLISVDRFICIVFTFSKRRLTVFSARVCTGVIWVVSIILSVVSVLLAVLDPDSYDLSDVCVGLPLIRKNVNLQSTVDPDTLNSIGIEVNKIVAASSASTWQYSVAIFLGVNFICFTIILIAYVAIFITVRFSSSAVGRKGYSSKEIRMALKLSFIVATDFFCWMPIVILGIIVQVDDVYISPDVYAWLVALVLPINSAINPYLYTIVDRYRSSLKVKSSIYSSGPALKGSIPSR
ncbi:G-protein coupled receptor GRL101-like isoform X1 [Lytechinus variegatus]|uniref:G-protein coupled receptor GRL101-like isoform X1 n=2 Tax=Lytechinus variegatus TaxID=7654 RepID=UPI001BB1CEEC|nr:G-protein coupled receptor GRL101-like isoform X1 [Lytechinus variegatus]